MDTWRITVKASKPFGSVKLADLYMVSTCLLKMHWL